MLARSSTRRNWLMRMRWHDLLFMHWPVRADVLRPLIPGSLRLDTFDGDAWIGVVPFHMSGIRARFMPPIPGLWAFPELNVRTYVTHGQKPGVWFFSLDAASALAVRVARWTFHLSYFDAAMSVHREGEDVVYRSRRTHRGAPACAFAARYRPTGAVFRSKPGSLDAFLTDRLCLYSTDRRRRMYRGDIEHPPWPLQPAEADVQTNTMTQPLGIRLPETQPLLHFARCLDVRAERIKAL